MAYKLSVTEHAQADLDKIIACIVLELKNAPAAIHLLDQIETVYANLMQTPGMDALCRQTWLARQGLRKAPVGGYLLIYKVDEPGQTVYAERFFSNLQDCETKL